MNKKFLVAKVLVVVVVAAVVILVDEEVAVVVVIGSVAVLPIGLEEGVNFNVFLS
jgi:hypothetical protein